MKHHPPGLFRLGKTTTPVIYHAGEPSTSYEGETEGLSKRFLSQLLATTLPEMRGKNCRREESDSGQSSIAFQVWRIGERVFEAIFFLSSTLHNPWERGKGSTDDMYLQRKRRGREHLSKGALFFQD